jgi:hypothetical protein
MLQNTHPPQQINQFSPFNTTGLVELAPRDFFEELRG